ncbi:MAG: nicotinate-nucleotide--dimethylbenzimidazole phosphoribosyltransferase [Kofleriaceae bacterium]
MTLSPVLRHVIEAIAPASEAHRRAALRLLAEAGPLFDRLGGQLAAAQHAAPHARRRTLVIAAGDHGAGDPGVALGADHPTVVAARAIHDGSAAVRHLARRARAEVLLVDCGCAESALLPPSTVALGRGPSGDARAAAALTPLEVTAALEAGVAVALSLLDGGTDVLALGHLGLGAEISAASVVGALLDPTLAPPHERSYAELARREAERAPLSPLDVLAAFGGPETAALAGLTLAAASLRVPVVLDGEATAVAALLAARLAPPVTGYLIASQRGDGCLPALLDALELPAVFSGGVGHGEGAAAAMVLGLIDQVIDWTAERSPGSDA